MKTQLTILLIAILCHPIWAMTDDKSTKDTVIIEFGSKSKMVIIAESAKDLKDLQEYDINQMIGELNAELDSAGGAMNVQLLSISDSTGNRYVKDSVEAENLTVQTQTPLVYYGDENVGSAPVAYPSKSYEGSYRSRSHEYRRSRTKRTISALELGIGLNNWLEDGSFPDESNTAYTVRPWGSWYTSLGLNSRTHIGGPVVLNWGVDFSWYSWKMEDPNIRITKEPDMTTFVVDPLINGSMSKLSATYINMSIVPMLDFSYGKRKRNSYGTFRKYGQKGIRIGAGGYVGYRVDSWTKLEYESDGDDNLEKTKSNFYLNNLRYGLRGQIGFNGINLFMNYDLNEVFSTDRGPKLQGISFGIIL